MDVPEEILDGVRELITIGVGRSAGMLNRLTNAHVTLTVPEVRISDDVRKYQNEESLHPYTEDTSQIILQFSGEITGSFSLIIPHESALNLVVILTGEEGSPDEMDALRVETLLEVGNIIISSTMSALSILLTTGLSFQFPIYRTGKRNQFAIEPQMKVGIIARTRFEVQQKMIEGEMIICLNRESYDRLDSSIRSIMERGL